MSMICTLMQSFILDIHQYSFQNTEKKSHYNLMYHITHVCDRPSWALALFLLIFTRHVPALRLGLVLVLPGHRAGIMWGRQGCGGGWVCVRPAGLQATICFTLMEINKWTGRCLCEANYVWEVRREREGCRQEKKEKKISAQPMCVSVGKKRREKIQVRVFWCKNNVQCIQRSMEVKVSFTEGYRDQLKQTHTTNENTDIQKIKGQKWKI